MIGCCCRSLKQIAESLCEMNRTDTQLLRVEEQRLDVEKKILIAIQNLQPPPPPPGTAVALNVVFGKTTT